MPLDELQRMDSNDTTEKSGIQFPLKPLTGQANVDSAKGHKNTRENKNTSIQQMQQKKNKGEEEDTSPLTSSPRLSPSSKRVQTSRASNKLKSTFQGLSVNMAAKYEAKNVGLGEVATGELKLHHGPVEEHEARVRAQSTSCWLMRFLTTLLSAIMVFIVYLITLETLLSCALCVGLTVYWYKENEGNIGWNGGGMDWIVLGFAVVTPLTVTITLAFRRRERALYEISRIRSLCFQIYQAHVFWDWDSGKGREKAMTPDQWLEHGDQVLEQLIGIGDELSRFLTLPTSSRSYHRMLKSGRKKAANIVEVAYRLLDSLYTKRVVKLSIFTEKIKSFGLSPAEISRLRQYERFIGEAIENLRMIKMYRTPQALRSFGRVFTLLVPAFYSSAFAQVALELDSFTMGILFAMLTPLVLTALFQSVQLMEDPFVGWVTLDGIDVNEEMEVLHFHQLISARSYLFPDAAPFETMSKAAIVSDTPAPRSIGGSYRTSHFAPSLGDEDKTSGEMEGSYRLSHFAMDGSLNNAGARKPSLSRSAAKHRRNG